MFLVTIYLTDFSLLRGSALRLCGLHVIDLGPGQFELRMGYPVYNVAEKLAGL